MRASMISSSVKGAVDQTRGRLRRSVNRGAVFPSYRLTAAKRDE